jgi:exopolyphosphatase/pppGpp-phosphohydrolase
MNESLHNYNIRIEAVEQYLDYLRSKNRVSIQAKNELKALKNGRNEVLKMANLRP